jgi:hypothetical protein
MLKNPLEDGGRQLRPTKDTELVKAKSKARVGKMTAYKTEPYWTAGRPDAPGGTSAVTTCSYG